MDDIKESVIRIKGKNDIGNIKGRRKKVNKKRIKRWRGNIGKERWDEELGKWRIIGIKSIVIG